MDKIKTIFLLGSTLFLFLGIGFVSAVVEGPQVGDQGPSQEEINQFQQEFGAPPEAFQGVTPEKPKFEQPGSVPEEAKQYATDKELVDIYCAMTRWKSGDFFSALDAVNKYIVPSVEKVKELGIDVSLPDIESLRAEGQKRIETICSAKTLSEAEGLVQDFSSWGQSMAAGKFDNLKSDLESKMKAKGDELRNKIKAEIDPFIAEERVKIESDLRQEAEGIAAQKQAELQDSKTPPDMTQIRGEITQQIMARVDVKKAELKNKVQSKVNELMGGQKEKFEEIGNLFQGIGGKINAEIAANKGQYDQYKKQAFELRKTLVFKILDKNIENGLKQLEAANSDIETAKKEDPTIKSVGEIKAEIQQDRNTLSVKLDAALEAGDEAAFQGALNDFRTKWEGFRDDMEKAAGQSISKACTVALAQFDQAKGQIEPGLAKVKSLQSKCAISSSDECSKVNELSSRFGTLNTKLTDLQSEMAIAEKMCQTPETADRNNLIALMKKIQSDAEDVKIYGQALEAEKTKAIADSAQKVCSQVLPQLNAAKIEIANNDLVILQSKIDKCKGKSTDECNAVNQLTDRFNNLKTKIKDFSNDVEKAEQICQNPTESNLEDLRGVLTPLRDRGDELKTLAKELQADQTEKASEKAFCRAIVPQLDSIKGEISAGLNELASAPSSDKSAAVKKQADAILKKISDLNVACQKAGTNPPSDSLIASIESLKADKDAIMKAIADLKTEKEKSYEMGKEITIVKNSSWEGILPAGKTLELFGRINYQKAAGGQWLMEISVNGQPLTSPLLNKGKTFKYSDGRAFPYFSSGGGTDQTSFNDGKPYTYYKTQSPAWMLFYVPDFNTDNTSSGGGYQVVTDPGQAHRYVWDISSLVGNSQTITVKISNNGYVGAQTLPITVKMYVK